MIGRIINWNCRGIRRNIEEIKMFMQEFNSIAICLQERCIDQTKAIGFRKYSVYNHYSQAINGKTIGGLSIVVRKISHMEKSI